MTPRLLALVVLAAPLVARADDPKPASLDGTYTYTSTVTIKLTAPVSQTIHDTGSGQLTVGKSSKADLVFTWTAKGVTCNLKASRTASGVKFAKGQTCSQVEDGVADLTMTLETGSGTANDDDLDLKFTWRLSGTLNGHAVTGSAVEVTTAEKQ